MTQFCPDPPPQSVKFHTFFFFEWELPLSTWLLSKLWYFSVTILNNFWSNILMWSIDISGPKPTALHQSLSLLLVLLSMYAMFILWMTLHVTQDVSPITWILWWQIRFIGIWMCVSPCVSTPTLDQFCRRLLLFLSWLIFLKTF